MNTSRGAAARPHANTFFNNIAWRKIAALPKANNARSRNKSTSTDLSLLPRVGYTPTDSGGREKAPANGAGKLQCRRRLFRPRSSLVSEKKLQALLHRLTDPD